MTDHIESSCSPEYVAAHARCPRCSSDSIEQTEMAFFGPNVVDRNRATCHDCGWVGIVHDLKPAKDGPDAAR